VDFLELLNDSRPLLVGFVFVLGLLVGSFLNVVIHRLPEMLQRSWRIQCQELLGDEIGATGSGPSEKYNLVVPRSRCPSCGHGITAVENIPVVSYLLLRGRCSACGTRIPIRYPLVELGTGLLSALVAWRFGATAATMFALAFTWALVALSGIDIDRKLLPDAITLPLLWLGLLVCLGGYRAADGPVFADIEDAVIGAAAGYLSLWSVYHLFRLLTGKEGMGYGDFKLLGAVGAWLGWQYLPLTILLSAVVGAVVGGSALLISGRDSQTHIPFGPFLAAAGWVAMMWGPAIMDVYLDASGLR
jgi:leader peptidase (prepilin peptidase)/N-methyltransferase